MRSNALDKFGVSPSAKPPTSLSRWKQRLMASTKLATSLPPPPGGWRRGSLNNTLLAVQSSLHRDKPGGGVFSADGIQTPFMRDMLRTDLRRDYLVQLKRHGREYYDSLPEELRVRYDVSQGALFGSVPSEKRSPLRQEVAEQMYFLITRFSGITDIESRTSYKNLVTVFNQQCDLIEPKKPVENHGGGNEGDGQTNDGKNTPISSS